MAIFYFIDVNTSKKNLLREIKKNIFIIVYSENTNVVNIHLVLSVPNICTQGSIWSLYGTWL